MSGMLMSMRTTSGLSEVASLQRLGPGRGRADDVDVPLEAEQLREVVARLRDVVDDQDTDLVGHLRVWLSSLLFG